ncbi:geranylgeranyl diphosphate synthase type II [Roseibium hamelinense]|uniref:Geranylgeranyl diphosphate synthase type II n=1 Tax=Roseibium hamelinense TaxID=150831 RepID=A0A562SXD9_9HYPH|nr:polyprenyl synthetase family protein [Roseibium hamelinense]MTI44839.1 polyprenyl synthetase family protein [Roseibium hamelinense]TWI85967.1 geranylgeranyl diphosphate synthase type II [Roseibium hamelinense]
MNLQNRIERGLEQAITFATAGGKPPKVCAAVRHAVFPGGARIRPRLCLAVALASGDRNPDAATAAATAIELLHCASLVHDDLPCFDDSDLRRGRSSVHAEFGEPLAVLAGDGLIVSAFETLARGCAQAPETLGPLVTTIGRAVGTPHGLVAGQAWESEPEIDLRDYHRAKTASLFTGATAAGAIASNADPLKWLELGEALGAAYQVADDLRDTAATIEELGKPVGQDVAHARPNAVEELGLAGAVTLLQETVRKAADAIPECAGADMLRQLILGEAKRLVPKKLAQSAA